MKSKITHSDNHKKGLQYYLGTKAITTTTHFYGEQ